MSFRDVSDNLRQSFRVLADGRPGAEVLELPGISIASLAVSFQMFNAAFVSARVETQSELEERLQPARHYFDSRGLPWALWICEDWLAAGVRRKLSRTCEMFGLRLSSEMPGMAAGQIQPPQRRLPELEIRRVEGEASLNDFRALGSHCFHVPIVWFSEVFDERVAARQAFVCWVGYRDGTPIATAASVASDGALGIYNVATVPEHRKCGYGEAITRHAIDAGLRASPAGRFVLQSTSAGQRLYERMGFGRVTRVLVYNSAGQRDKPVAAKAPAAG
jgi:ribosomal protein S18 acetylase RimI-like enzyme